MQLKRVVVTGIGTLTPLGNNLNDYWNGLINGVSGADMITLFDASKFKTRFACEVKGFDPTEFMEKKEARKLDRFAQLAIVASDMAVKDAGISKENVDVDRVGVIFASGIGGLTTFQDEVINFALGDGTPRFNPFFIPKMIFGYCCRTDFYAPWVPRPQFCRCKRLCIQYQWNYCRCGYYPFR